jgi:phosphoribosyl-dephospho-CoA transferase
VTPRPLPTRHELVWLAPGWRAALAAPVAPALAAALDGWIARGRPLVACRGDGVAPGELALAAALAPAGPLRRARLVVRSEAVAWTAPPLSLGEVIPSAPLRWRPPLAALARDGREAGLAVRVHGSLAWQHLTGERHLRPGSDVDLLVPVATTDELRRALALLAPRAHDSPRLDGEILLPGGLGVAWRELAARPARVLVRSTDALALVPAADALGPLAGGLS